MSKKGAANNADIQEGAERLGELILYITPDGAASIQLKLEGGAVWLSQKEMARLYQVSVPAIAQHLRSIFVSGELELDSVVKEYLITASDRKNYKTKLYSLEAVLAVGYRVRSHRGVQFRQWATEHLAEFLAKGFLLDDARLKEGYPQGAEYFDELLERIRDIRSAEKVFYRKLRDIFALSTDYSNQSREALHLFFQTVQNKLHWAAAGKTAAEIVLSRADASKLNMGLTNWPGNRIRKADVSIAKSYLEHEELDTLNRIVTMFLDQAEFRARRRQVVYMADWEPWLDNFLQGQELPILTHAGRVRSDAAKAHAEKHYALFQAERLALEAADDEAAALEELAARTAKSLGGKKPGSGHK
ncbi:virulence RhuM family protein [Desulfovibrio sp. OttesenSCG-928-M16]|nr:virulence RhuM family protein [Desulfovibrio sp. OttesenSCG-928-M16]